MEEEEENDRNAIVAQLLIAEERLNLGSSSSVGAKLSSCYVTYHELLGHGEYCFAWLDNAVCPQMLLNNCCCFKHEYPIQWSLQKRERHKKMENYMESLFSNSTIDNMLEHDDGEDSDDDESYQYHADVSQMELGRNGKKYFSPHILKCNNINIVSDYESSVESSESDLDQDC